MLSQKVIFKKFWELTGMSDLQVRAEGDLNSVLEIIRTIQVDQYLRRCFLLGEQLFNAFSFLDTLMCLG